MSDLTNALLRHDAHEGLREVRGLVNAIDRHARWIAAQVPAEPALAGAADGISALAGRAREAVALAADCLARDEAAAASRWTQVVTETTQLLVARYARLVSLVADGAALAAEHDDSAGIELAVPLAGQVTTLTASL